MNRFIKEGNQISKENIEVAANIILNETTLNINGENYIINEIEFYLHNRTFPDPYTHCHKNQLQYGFWYFHAFSNGTYKEFFSGVDIALGNGKDKYCGILIRSISNEKEFIQGPSNVVKHIKKLHNVPTIKELIDVLSLKLRDCENRGLDLFKGTRIGLSDKYSEYKDLHLRFSNTRKIKGTRKLIPLN